ncbi:MAG: Membrane-bound lytic murein transglycosylase D [Chlorobi bacterium OLB4]|nr:MAG: Membrane-bound lytic murein transglycosylase D [Chlorobi bacterium OLB4]
MRYHLTFLENCLKIALRLFLFSLVLSASYFMIGCSSSEIETDTQRIKDSIEVYGYLDKAFGQYIDAMEQVENYDDEKASKLFEKTLQSLNAIDYRLLDAPGNIEWRQNFDELAKSVVQDYLNTQSNIPKKSLVFKLADELRIHYTEIKEMEETDFVNEPLPDGDDIPLVRNEAVDGYIDFFTNTERGRNFIDRTTYRSGKYFPIMRKILRYHEAPEENIYLSIQESGLDPKIVSRAGAVGLWQFMPSTGAAYGLFQDAYRDDRRDFEKSTDAAARHLLDLYRSFDDWYLAWAAYNAGPGRVNSAIRKSGSRNFWTLRSYLPGETKNYVPSILALSHIFRFPEEFGFTDLEYANPISFDRVFINAELTLQQIADMSGSDIETIRELNSELTGDVTPVYDVPYMIRIPYDSYDKFAEAYEKSDDFQKHGMETPEYAGNELFSVGNVASVRFSVTGYNPQDPRRVVSTHGKTQFNYYFQEKDLLSVIAIKYGVRPTDLRIWNNLVYGINPEPKQSLIVYVNSEPTGSDDEGVNSNTGTTDELETIDESLHTLNNDDLKTPSITDLQVTREPEAEVETEQTEDKFVQTETVTEEIKHETTSEPDVKTETTKKEVKPKEKKRVYMVTEGDMLSTIASRFGVRVSDIKQWNGLESDKILVGQKLKIYSDNDSEEKNIVHTVSVGEHLTMIADKYGISVSDLMNWNDLSTDVIYVGQKLRLSAQKTSYKKDNSPKQHTYKVKPGDNLSDIANSLGVSLSKLMEWNNIKNENLIKVGQYIVQRYLKKKNGAI